MKRLILTTICALFLLCGATASANVFCAKAYPLDSEIVLEVGSGRILFEKHADEKMYPASTTKILTAICVIENANLQEKITVPKAAVGIEGSSIYLREGEILSVEELLYGLMLRSGNDAATALALHVGKSIDNFAELMNETARKIGAGNSNFVNPHGLPNDNHYVTAKDLARITAYALKNDDFKKIVSTKKIEISNGDMPYKRLLVNKNKMLFECEGATGVKTGYTKKAGRCLVSSCERNGMELVSVVLNCPSMFETAKAHFDKFHSYYKLYKLFESDYIVDFLPAENQENIGVYIQRDVVLPLTEEEFQNVKICYDLPHILPKGTKKDQAVGEMRIYIANNLIFSEKIYTINEVD